MRPTRPDPTRREPPVDERARIPEFGSAAHLEKIARRLSKNVRFREQVEASIRYAFDVFKDGRREEAAS